MLVKKMFWFGVIGVVNTTLDWGVFWCLSLLLPHTLTWIWLAKGTSYGAGVMCSYLLNSRITFKEHNVTNSASQRRRQFIRFVYVSLICLGINSATYALLSGGQFIALLPLLGATLITYLVGFTLNHRWTFGRHASEAE